MQWQPQKLQDWHVRVIDLLIGDPTLTSEQVAEHLQCNIHPVTISLLRRTDLFRLSLEERRDEISRGVDRHTLDRLTGKVMKLASVAVESLTEQVERERLLSLAAPSRAAIETCEMALKSLGYIKGSPAPNVTVQQVVTVDARTLNAARDMMRDAHARPSSEGQLAFSTPLALRAG